MLFPLLLLFLLLPYRPFFRESASVRARARELKKERVAQPPYRLNLATDQESLADFSSKSCRTRAGLRSRTLDSSVSRTWPPTHSPPWPCPRRAPPPQRMTSRADKSDSNSTKRRTDRTREEEEATALARPRPSWRSQCQRQALTRGRRGRRRGQRRPPRRGPRQGPRRGRRPAVAGLRTAGRGRRTERRTKRGTSQRKSRGEDIIFLLH